MGHELGSQHLAFNSDQSHHLPLPQQAPLALKAGGNCHGAISPLWTSVKPPAGMGKVSAACRHPTPIPGDGPGHPLESVAHLCTHAVAQGNAMWPGVWSLPSAQQQKRGSKHLRGTTVLPTPVTRVRNPFRPPPPLPAPAHGVAPDWAGVRAVLAAQGGMPQSLGQRNPGRAVGTSGVNRMQCSCCISPRWSPWHNSHVSLGATSQVLAHAKEHALPRHKVLSLLRLGFGDAPAGSGHAGGHVFPLPCAHCWILEEMQKSIHLALVGLAGG